MSCTYKEIIEVLEKADGATYSTQSTSKLVYQEFTQHHPNIYVGRPSRFLETARRIAGPIKNGKLQGTARESYLKRQWKPRVRNTTTAYQGSYILAKNN